MRNFYLLLFIVLSSFGCSADYADETLPVLNKFHLSISRTEENLSSDVSMKASFKDKDAVGIFAGAIESKWQLTGGRWETETPYYWTNTDLMTYSVYYPYVEGATLSKVPMPSLLNQNGLQSCIDSLDFLCAQHSLAYKDTEQGKVSFVHDNALKHQYALLVLTFKSKFVNNRANLLKLDIEGPRLFNSSYYSFDDHKVHVNEQENNNLLSLSLVQKSRADETKPFLLKILVNPVNLDSHLNLKVDYLNYGKHFTVTTPLPAIEFQSGYYYKYDLNINTRGELTIVGVDINGRIEEHLPDLNLPR